jgi:hypothetical protein
MFDLTKQSLQRTREMGEKGGQREANRAREVVVMFILCSPL